MMTNNWSWTLEDREIKLETIKNNKRLLFFNYEVILLVFFWYFEVFYLCFNFLRLMLHSSSRLAPGSLWPFKMLYIHFFHLCDSLIEFGIRWNNMIWYLIWKIWKKYMIWFRSWKLNARFISFNGSTSAVCFEKAWSKAPLWFVKEPL